MSVKVMGKVWDLDLPHNKLIVLLAMADHADHEGNNVFPSQGLVAWKTGYSIDQVRRIQRALVKDSLLKVESNAPGKPIKYSIDLTMGKLKEPYTPSIAMQDLAKSKTLHNDAPPTPSIAMQDPTPSIAMQDKPSVKPSIKPSSEDALPLAVLPEMIAANEGLRIVTPVKEKSQTPPGAKAPTPNSAPTPSPKDNEPSLHSRPRDVMAENMRGWQIIEAFIKAWPEDVQDRTIHHKSWFKKQAAEMAAMNPPFTDEEITTATKNGIGAKGEKFSFDDLGQALKELRMSRKRSSRKIEEYIPPKRRNTPEEFLAWQAKQKALEAANE